MALSIGRLFCVCLISFGSTLAAASNTFLDYQNYNHGYCPDCNCYPCKCGSGGCPDQGTCPKPNPCDPPATTACTQCGLNIWYVGIGIVVLAAAGAIIVGSNNGSPFQHNSP